MRHRIVVLLALGLLTLGVPALGQTTPAGTTPAGTTETTAAGSATTTGAAAVDYEPAVVAETPAPEEVVQPWTVRFLIPTLLALVTIVLFATAVRYFTNVVRTRYRVVE